MNFFSPITRDSFVPAISFETIKQDSRTPTSESYSQKNTSVAAAVTSKQARATNRKRHPNIPNMIDEAIYEKSLYGKGLSLVAVKKYLAEKYGMNMKYSAKRIREYIKESVASGRFIRKSGYGANGSFSLSVKVRNYLNRKKHEPQSKTQRSIKSKKLKKEKTEPNKKQH